VWHSGNALDLISIVIACPARLVPGWVIVLGWVKHLSTEQGTQVDSACTVPPRVGKNECWLWLWPLLGKNGEFSVTVAPVIRTAGILACSRLKALAVI